MRVLEPSHFKHNKPKKKGRNNGGPILGIIVVLGLIGGGGYYFINKQITSQSKQPTQQPVIANTVLTATAAAKLKPKQFTGNQFRDIYRSTLEAYPNTEAFSPAPPITGNAEADAQIRKLAEARGFRLTRIPVTALVKTDEPKLKGQTDDLLQPAAFSAWQEIKAAAEKENIPLQLYSAYRSPEWQRELFMERLLARGVTVNQVINGTAVNALNATFEVTAVPGYSRHHTGYAVDFWCEDGIGDFGSSVCFDWLNKNNYLNAKQFGWIPSYPPDADEQGPEPEPWEYVWVGRDVLYE